MNNIVRLEEVTGVAKVFKESGYFIDVKTEAQAAVKVMAGQELGIPPFASMNGVYIVKGKTVLSATLMAGLIKKSGRYNYKTVKHTDSECELDVYEKWDASWEKIGSSTFTIGDAQKAGLTNNPTWKSYPRNMLFARAISNAARWFCSDVFNGPVYVEGELEEPFIAVDTTARDVLNAPVVTEGAIASEGTISESLAPTDAEIITATVEATQAGLKPLDVSVAGDEEMEALRLKIKESQAADEIAEWGKIFKQNYTFTEEQTKSVKGWIAARNKQLKEKTNEDNK